MSLYLDADCVFDFLLKNKIFIQKEWKNTHFETSKYNVSFDYKNGSLKICCFEITVENKKHCILNKSIKTLAIKYGFYEKIKTIFSDCAID